MKIVVKQAMHMGKKKSNMWVATFGRWEQYGSKDAAVELLMRRINDAQDNAFRRKYIVTPKATFALYWADGWAYDIVHPDGSTSSCMFNTGRTFDEAFDCMQKHAKDYNS